MNTLINQHAKSLLLLFKSHFTSPSTRLLLKTDRSLRIKHSRPTLQTDLALKHSTDQITDPGAVDSHVPSVFEHIVTRLNKQELVENFGLIVPPLLQMMDVHHFPIMQHVLPTLLYILQTTTTTTTTAKSTSGCDQELDASLWEKWGLLPVLEEVVLEMYWSFRTTHHHLISCISPSRPRSGTTDADLETDVNGEDDHEMAIITNCLDSLLTSLEIMVQLPISIPSTSNSSQHPKQKLLPPRQVPDTRTPAQKRTEKIFASLLSGASETANSYLRRVYLQHIKDRWMDLLDWGAENGREGTLILKHTKALVHMCCYYITLPDNESEPESGSLRVESLNMVRDVMRRCEVTIGWYHAEIVAALAEMVVHPSSAKPVSLCSSQLQRKNSVTMGMLEAMAKEIVGELSEICKETNADVEEQFLYDASGIRDALPDVARRVYPSSVLDQISD